MINLYVFPSPYAYEVSSNLSKELEIVLEDLKTQGPVKQNGKEY